MKAKPPKAASYEIPKVSKPANRALASVGVTNLRQLAKHTKAEIAALHGMGPKGIRILTAALKAAGLAFRS